MQVLIEALQKPSVRAPTVLTMERVEALFEDKVLANSSCLIQEHLERCFSCSTSQKPFDNLLAAHQQPWHFSFLFPFFLSPTSPLIRQLHVLPNMCASTYTLNFNSLLNIVNATQPPDLLSLGIHMHRQGRADGVRCSPANTWEFFEGGGVDTAAAVAKAKRTKQLKCSLVETCCCCVSSWEFDPPWPPDE